MKVKWQNLSMHNDFRKSNVLNKLLSFSCLIFQFGKGKIYCNYKAPLYSAASLAFCNHPVLGVIQNSSLITLYQIDIMVVIAERLL